jgi:hypothetical protein
VRAVFVDERDRDVVRRWAILEGVRVVAIGRVTARREAVDAAAIAPVDRVTRDVVRARIGGGTD